jgi:hypothetical protein
MNLGTRSLWRHPYCQTFFDLERNKNPRIGGGELTNERFSLSQNGTAPQWWHFASGKGPDSPH